MFFSSSTLANFQLNAIAWITYSKGLKKWQKILRRGFFSFLLCCWLENKHLRNLNIFVLCIQETATTTMTRNTRKCFIEPSVKFNFILNHTHSSQTADVSSGNSRTMISVSQNNPTPHPQKQIQHAHHQIQQQQKMVGLLLYLGLRIFT